MFSWLWIDILCEEPNCSSISEGPFMEYGVDLAHLQIVYVFDNAEFRLPRVLRRGKIDSEHRILVIMLFKRFVMSMCRLHMC